MIPLNVISKQPKIKIPNNDTPKWIVNHTPERLQEIKEMKAAGITPPGHKNRSKNKTQRIVVTDIDRKVFDFLIAFQFATARQIALILNVTYETANRRMKRLQSANYVDSVIKENVKMLWVAKNKAFEHMKDVGLMDATTPFRRESTDIVDSTLAHDLAVVQVAAHLIAGSGLLGQNKYTINDLVLEKTIKRAWKSQAHKDDIKGFQGLVGSRQYQFAMRDLRSGAKQRDEIMESYPTLWTVHSDDPKLGPYRRPDLVINAEKKSTGNKRSIAIEVERSAKGPADYERIMTIYREDKIAYAGVIWVCANDRIKNMIEAAAKKVRFPSENLVLAYLPDAYGELYSGSNSL